MINKHTLNLELHALTLNIQNQLLQKQQTLGIAESCTGGLLSSQIVSLPGASHYFLGAIIAYSNDIKVKQLQVNENTIESYGSVSEEVALEMAQGVLKQFHCDWSIATTGIAGPDGGTQQKPVGTVCFALIGPKQKSTVTAFFSGLRNDIQLQSCLYALTLLKQSL